MFVFSYECMLWGDILQVHITGDIFLVFVKFFVLVWSVQPQVWALYSLDS